jgi:hypothetical protein
MTRESLVVTVRAYIPRRGTTANNATFWDTGSQGRIAYHCIILFSSLLSYNFCMLPSSWDYLPSFSSVSPLCEILTIVDVDERTGHAGNREAMSQHFRRLLFARNSTHTLLSADAR